MRRCWLKNDTSVVIPAQAGIQSRRKFWIPACAGMILMFFLSSCGGSSSGPVDDPASFNTSVERSTYSDLINSPSYAGYLIVYFSKDSSVRMEDAGLLTAKDNKGAEAVDSFNTVLSEFPEARLERSSKEEPEMLDRRRAMLERRSGKKLVNWNSVYHIYIKDPSRANELYSKLKEVVSFVQPASKTTLTSLEGTPDFVSTGHQSYLKSYAEEGGLGAEAAWAAAATGHGVTIVDIEDGANFDHEDLPIDFIGVGAGGSVISGMKLPSKPGDYDENPFAIGHGSAVMGILAGIDNGHGVKGFVPDARVIMSNSTHNLEATVGFLAQPKYAGQILLIERQMNGGLSSGMCGVGGISADAQFGCMPVESDAFNYATIEEMTAAGITVVEAAGNGSVSLNDPNAYYDEVLCGSPTADPDHCINILGAGGDAGAIMVGAIQSTKSPTVALQKLDWSNCGTRINVSSWGRGVVSAGYPDPSGAFAWNGTPPSADFNSDVNNFYVNDFGGTSAASAIVAGTVALLQSYAKNLMGDFRYITPPKIREIITSTGRAVSGDDGCNLSVQPDIPAAMVAIDALWAETLAVHPQMGTYKEYLDYNDVPVADRLSETEEIALWQSGVGIRCFSAVSTFGDRDPVCPPYVCDDETSPYFSRGYCIGTGLIPAPCDDPAWQNYCKDRDLIPHIETPFDFDEDARADLTVWTEEGWKIDMSSSPTDDPQCNTVDHPVCRDNYGEWDASVDMPPLQDADAWIWPLVQDWNSDGRADFAVYDKKNSKLYIEFTTDDVLARQSSNWDRVLDYSSEWQEQMTADPYDRVNYRYARPVPGDYNGDNYIDFALACSDGYWRIDYGGADASAYGTFDDSLLYLTETQLTEAPGWAYLPAQGDYDLQGKTDISFKVPDGVSDEGRWLMYPAPDFMDNEWGDWFDTVPHMFGGNDWMPVASDYRYEVGGVITKDGIWKRMDNNYVMEGFADLIDETAAGIFGPDCYPVSTTFSGTNDMGVICSNGEWRIKYGLNGVTKYSHDVGSDGLRVVYHSNPSDNVIPPMPVYGGISFQDVRKNIAKFQKLFPSQPVPINADTFGSK